MTITAPSPNLRQPKGQPTGGQFAEKPRAEGAITLGVFANDQTTPVSAGESRAMVENGFASIDQAWLDADGSDSDIEEGHASGKAHAHAEMIGFLQSDNEGEPDYESIGERLLNDRREGFVLEQQPNWTGPGALTGLKRAAATDFARRRAAECFAAAESMSDVPDVAAHFFGQYEVFEELALDISAEGAFFTGEED